MGLDTDKASEGRNVYLPAVTNKNMTETSASKAKYGLGMLIVKLFVLNVN